MYCLTSPLFDSILKKLTCDISIDLMKFEKNKNNIFNDYLTVTFNLCKLKKKY